MNIQLPVHNMDKAAFLAWVQTQEGRYELAQGRVIMMPGASKDHAIIVMNLASLIRTQLDRRKWTVVAEFGLDAGPETLRYPDVMVDRAGNGRAFTATAPALLAEVLSPSTESLDLQDKAAETTQTEVYADTEVALVRDVDRCALNHALGLRAMMPKQGAYASNSRTGAALRFRRDSPKASNTPATKIWRR